MISRSRVLPSLSSSRQMMMAWNVSGLSQSPAIIVSRPASMRLAMAISPSRDRSSTEPISRRYMRTGSSVRSVGSFLGGRRNGRAGLLGKFVGVSLGVGGGRLGFGLLGGLVVLDDVDAHVGQHRHRVLDLLGGHFLGRQDRVQFVHGHIAAFLRGLDHLLDSVIGKVEKRAIGSAFAFGLRPLPFPWSWSPFFQFLHTVQTAARPEPDITKRTRRTLPSQSACVS